MLRDFSSYYELEPSVEQALRALLKSAWARGSTATADREVVVSSSRGDTATIQIGDEVCFVQTKYTQTGQARRDSRSWKRAIITPPKPEQCVRGDMPRYFSISTVELEGRMHAKVDTHGRNRVHAITNF